ncbi:MAG: CbtA family protein, partial [Candidatus Methylumidiphilus sp.]
WSPQDGWERITSTLVANVTMATGFGFLLVAAYALRPTVTPRQGAFWGAAGFAVFFLAPSFGLPPELPGTVAGALADRQAWWLATVSCTAAGLGLLAFAPKRWFKLGGAGLLIIPHLIGAPHPASYNGAAPEHLAKQFFIAALLANAIFWIALGIVSAWVYRRCACGSSKQGI